MRIVPDTRKITPEYLCFLINSPKYSQEIKSKQSGSGMGFVPKSVMQGLIVALPKRLEEQRVIAAALSDVESLLGGLDRLIAKKRDLKQVTMQRLLTANPPPWLPRRMEGKATWTTHRSAQEDIPPIIVRKS